MTGYKNCHAEGLTSIVLATKRNGSPLLRVFIAESHHTLWRNGVGYPREKMSVAFHRHRVNVTLINIFGTAENVVLVPYDGTRAFTQFRWDSVLLGGKGTFQPTGEIIVNARTVSEELSDSPVKVAGTTFHTIYVPKGVQAAWFVLEEGENAMFSPEVWSNHNLSSWDASLFYQPMTNEEIEKYLRNYNIPV